MFATLLLIFYIQILVGNIQPTVATCTTNIPSCRVSGSTTLYCTPIVPSVPQFIGMNITGCTEFRLQNEWALSSLPKETFTRSRGVQIIDLNRGGLSYLPCDLFYNLKDDIRHVYLHQNHIDTIQNCTFRYLQHLRTLDLTKNRVSRLEDFLFYTLTSLQRLNLDYNMILEISPHVFQTVNSSSLQNIDLSSNKISSIGKGVFTHLELKSLHISNNGLRYIHKESFLNSQTTIQTLNLIKNQLTDDVWKALEGLINLETMYLDNNKLTTVTPVVFNRLLKIQYIGLSNNLIQEVKDVRMRSRNLHFISLSYNNVSRFDTDVFSTTSTFSTSKSVTIDLSFNNLQMLHLRLPPCNKTCDIKLQNNRIKELTFTDSTRNRLNSIDVRNNHLITLSDSFPYSRYYYLSNNPLSTETSLSFIYQKLRDSISLYMANVSMFCSFSKVNQPDHILNISSLSTLDLSNNCITDEFLCSLKYNSTKRVYVNLDRNHISSVPECMVVVPNTISLSLQSNRISDVKFNNLHGKFYNLGLDGNLVTKLNKNITLVDKGSIELRSNKLGDLNVISVMFNILSYDYSKKVVDISNNSITELQTVNFTYWSNDDPYHFPFLFNLSLNSLSKLPDILSQFESERFTFHISKYDKYIFSQNNLRSISTIYYSIRNVKYFQADLDIYYDNNHIALISNAIVFVFSDSRLSYLITRISFNFAFNVFKSYPSCEYFLQTDADVYLISSISNINLSHNKLTQILKFDNTTACYLLMQKIDLSHNQIQNIQIKFTSPSIKSPTINDLNLSHNKLEFIVPYAFNNLTHLNTLDLSLNKLQLITEGLELMSLGNLNLSHNVITTVPSVMSKMRYLVQFDVSHNKIVQFNAKMTISFYGRLMLAGNPLDCSCSHAWIRNTKYITDDRCGSPSSSKGYLVKCYPIGHCNEKYMIYPSWETQSQCYNDKYIDMEIKFCESLYNITVNWETFGPYSPFGYLVMLKENGTTVFTSDTLDSHVKSYNTHWAHQADQICVHALNKDMKAHALKCINIFMLSPSNMYSSENSKVKQGSVAIIILAVLLSISIICLITFVLVIKLRTCICNRSPTRPIIHSTGQETEFSNNPIVSNYEIASRTEPHPENYENLDQSGIVSPVYEEIKT